MAERLLPGLIQDAFITLKAREFSVRKGEKGWTLWRRSPTGYVWIADFARKDDAVDFTAWMIGQHDIRPV